MCRQKVTYIHDSMPSCMSIMMLRIGFSGKARLALHRSVPHQLESVILIRTAVICGAFANTLAAAEAA